MYYVFVLLLLLPVENHVYVILPMDDTVVKVEN